MKLYLLVINLDTKKQFFKYFNCEWEMDKFKRKLKYSKKLMVIEDSRELSLNYEVDY